MTTASKGGRPTLFTPETVSRVLALIEKGMPLGLASQGAGITYATMHDYRKKHPGFDTAVSQALVRGIERRLQVIEDAAKDDWRAASWWLERCASQHFARNRVEISGPDGAPLVGAVQIFLPPKTGEPGAPPTVTVAEAAKEIENGN